jgi:hypothetical protein
VGKPERNRPLGRPKRRWKDNVKMDIREIGWPCNRDQFVFCGVETENVNITKKNVTIERRAGTECNAVGSSDAGLRSDSAVAGLLLFPVTTAWIENCSSRQHVRQSSRPS